jgi:hypothetical protein
VGVAPREHAFPVVVAVRVIVAVMRTMRVGVRFIVRMGCVVFVCMLMMRVRGVMIVRVLLRRLRSGFECA